MAAVPNTAKDGDTPTSKDVKPFELYQQQHETARASLLSKQQRSWWLDVGECSRALVGSSALQEKLLLQ
jgi:hypothetical protein